MGTLRGFPTPVAMCVIPGGAPGAHGGVSGLKAGDTLISVRHVSGDVGTNDDVTAEFSISDDETINNVGGTDTTGDFLIVVWTKPE